MGADTPRIQVLDKHTAELIAAGEVVERPASVVKELVENAIDALASAVTVEITGGGVSLMRITDNGCGIAREDVPKAFLRHSTSKIRTGGDLDAIGTLGFRGEALASVAAVARVELLTRAAGEETGVRYLIEGGEEVLREDTGCPEGTTIIVRDLFYNTPARMKFLKRDASEGSAVAAVLDRIALSRPEISFRFLREGKEALLTPGDCKLRSAVYAVYGKEFAAGLIPVDYELNGIRVSGFASKPAASRPNRNMQHFYINDRYVRSRTMMAALEAAYKGSVMTGKFPSCVLSLGISFEQVDVNVHPAKLEVRFSDERPVFDAVYYGVKSALAERDTRPELHLAGAPGRGKQASIWSGQAPPEEPARQIHFPQNGARRENPAAPEAAAPPRVQGDSHAGSSESAAAAPSPAQPVTAAFHVPSPDPSLPSPGSALAPDLFPAFRSGDAPVMAAEYNFALYTSDQDAPVKIDTLIEQNLPPRSEAEIAAAAAPDPAAPPAENGESGPVPIAFLGEAFKTYALLEVPEGLLFIDKHAAHERILYNRLRENAGAEAQMLLSPVAVTLTKEEYGALTEHLDLAGQAGFELEDFGGGTVLVRSVPALLSGEDVPSLIAEIAGGLLRDGRLPEPQRLDEILHSVACKAAVKAGRKSEKEELLELAQEIFASNEIRYCPHGRPVAFLLRQKELEKQFGRIQG